MLPAILPDISFRGAYRLHKTDEFSSVFAFRRVLRGRFFMLHTCPNTLDTARLGLVVAKKLARRAHERNLVKRIVRENFRLCRHGLPRIDIIARLSSPVTKATREEISADLCVLLQRLSRFARA